jgi:hypothetical protein
MGEGRNVCRVSVGKPEGRVHLEDQEVDGRVGSNWTLGRSVGGVCGVDSPGPGWGLLAGFFECGDEPSGPGATESVSINIVSALLVTSPYLYFLKQ